MWPPNDPLEDARVVTETHIGHERFVSPPDVETMQFDWGTIKWLAESRVTGSGIAVGLVILEPGKGHATFTGSYAHVQDAINLPKTLLPAGVKAGDVLTLSLERDSEATRKLVEETRALQQELTKGDGADYVLECVGTPESMAQAIGITRPGGSVGYVGVPHGVELDAADLFFRHVRLFGGPAPVRATRSAHRAGSGRARRGRRAAPSGADLTPYPPSPRGKGG